MSNRVCRGCEFYEDRTGFCRRFPPTPVIISVKANENKKENKDIAVSKYPVISFPDADWCGEFNYR